MNMEPCYADPNQPASSMQNTRLDHADPLGRGARVRLWRPDSAVGACDRRPHGSALGGPAPGLLRPENRRAESDLRQGRHHGLVAASICDGQAVPPAIKFLRTGLFGDRRFLRYACRRRGKVSMVQHAQGIDAISDPRLDCSIRRL